MISRKITSSIFVTTVVICFMLANNTNAQQTDKKPVVQVSPKASVSQTIGFTEVTISYSRPGVKGRNIWGGLIPYDAVWRAGANEATKITFNKDVFINGSKLPAGSYAFFAIPTTSEWTLIFNKVADQWGAYSYEKNKAQDALQIKVKPVEHIFTEWLEYNFSDMDVQKAGMKNSAMLNLDWGNLRISFKVETETK